MEGAKAYDLPLWLNYYADLLDVIADSKVRTVVEAFDSGEVDKDDLVKSAELRLRTPASFKWMAACREMYNRFEDEFHTAPVQRAPTETPDGEPAYDIGWRGAFDSCQFYLSNGVQILIHGHSEYRTTHRRPTEDDDRYLIIVEE